LSLHPFLGDAFRDDFRAAPFVLYDVGAAGGIYDLFPGVPFGLWKAYGFEPVPTSCAPLQQRYRNEPAVIIEDIALSSRNETATFRIFEDVERSSGLIQRDLMFTNGQARYQDVPVQCLRLSSYVENKQAALPDFIKLDTEGTELDVLKGAEGGALEQEILGVISEVKFLPFAGGGTSFAEMALYLERMGFLLVDLQTSRCSRAANLDFGGKKGALDSGNVLFLRDYYALYRDSLKGNKIKARAKLLKMLAVLVRYLYLDYAVELAAFGRDEGLLTPTEASGLLREFTAPRDLSWRLPNFPGKAKLALLFDYLSYVLHPEMKLAVPPMHNNFGNRRRALSWPRKRKAAQSVRLIYPVRAYTDPSKLDLTIDLGGGDDARDR